MFGQALFVDEINLRVQIFYLRKALGTDRDLVKNVRGRGYFLATHISCGPTRAVAPAEELQHRSERQKTLVETGWFDGRAVLADPVVETTTPLDTPRQLLSLLRSTLKEQMTVKDVRIGAERRRNTCKGPRWLR